jgi:16S rRNA U1498 N3-methylase RsmE
MGPTNQEEAAEQGTNLSQVIQIDEGKIQAHLGEVVRTTVEDTLNAMLGAEANRLCRAATNAPKTAKERELVRTDGSCTRRSASP